MGHIGPIGHIGHIGKCLKDKKRLGALDWKAPNQELLLCYITSAQQLHQQPRWPS